MSLQRVQGIQIIGPDAAVLRNMLGHALILRSDIEVTFS